jgi:hypothetical protein
VDSRNPSASAISSFRPALARRSSRAGRPCPARGRLAPVVGSRGPAQRAPRGPATPSAPPWLRGGRLRPHGSRTPNFSRHTLVSRDGSSGSRRRSARGLSDVHGLVARDQLVDVFPGSGGVALGVAEDLPDGSRLAPARVAPGSSTRRTWWPRRLAEHDTRPRPTDRERVRRRRRDLRGPSRALPPGWCRTLVGWSRLARRRRERLSIAA